MAELAYKTYNTMYIIEPGGTEKVEANPDAIGLKVGVIFDTSRDRQEMHFYRFICHNDSVLTITSMDTEDIDYYGGKNDCVSISCSSFTSDSVVDPEGTNLIGKGKLRESSVEPFNMAAETCNMELATKKVNRAVEEMKKVVSKVKDTTEEAIKTVTGKEVNLDFINIGSSHHNTQGHDGMSMHRDPSMSSLSSAATFPSSSNNGNFSTAGNAMNSSNAQASLMGNGQRLHSNSNVPLSQNGKPLQTPAKAIPTTASNVAAGSPSATETASALKAQQQQQEEEKAAAQEKWEAELERAKRQKRWEMEIERIRRERAEREHLAELEKQRMATTAAPVVGQGGCACVIS